MFLAGQVGMDRDGKLVGGGVVAQFEQALANLLTALAAAGGQPADLVSATIYIVDLADYQAHARADRRRLASAGRCRVPGHGGRGRDPAVGPRGPGGDPGHRGGQLAMTLVT